MATRSEMSETQSAAQTLRRSMGLWLITLYGLGNILGAGIYVLVGKVAGAAGVYAPFAFVITIPLWVPSVGALVALGLLLAQIGFAG